MNQLHNRLANLLQQGLSKQQKNQQKSQIKSQLSHLYEFISQQFIKLSAYYETKLQYQAGDYQQQIGALKQQIQRQYKVIGLMKAELEDLVVLVSHQRAGEGMNGQGQQCRQQNFMQMQQQKEEEQWRVKKDQERANWYQNQSQAKQQAQNYQQSVHKARTIFGLQVIAEEDTQRTLMSVCDEEYNTNANNDYNDFEESLADDYYDEKDQQQNRFEEQITEKIHSNGQMRIEQTTDEKQTGQIKRAQLDLEQRQKSNVEDNMKQELIQEEENQFLNSSYSPHQRKNNQQFIKDDQAKFSSRFEEFQNYKSEKTQNDNENENEEYSSIEYKEEKPLQFQKKYAQNLFEEQPLDYDSPQFQTQDKKHNHMTSVKPHIYFNTQQYKSQQQIQKRLPPKPQSFVQNPFSKKKSSQATIKIQHQTQKQQQIISSKKQMQKRNVQKSQRNQSYANNEEYAINERQMSSKLFLQQFRKSFVKNCNKNGDEMKRRDDREDVMFILEMIAMKNTDPPNSKKSQRQQNSIKQGSSHSKSRDKQQQQPWDSTSSSKIKSTKKRLSTQKPHYTEENPSTDSQCTDSRISMLRCPTSYDNDTSSHRYANVDEPSQYDWASSDYRSNQFCYHSGGVNLQQDMKSLQTTFGRQASFQQFKQPLSTNVNRENCNEKYLNVDRKGSGNWNSHNIGEKEKVTCKNKENQRHRRMSERQVGSKSSLVSSLLQKKQSTKYLKRNSSTTTEQSVSSMLQSHLQNSNKFLVGSKKQQVKYDGQRITVGSTAIRHGHGILYYSNGLIYEGEFNHNKRSGYGLLKFNHVELYSGEWQNDELSGKGKIRNCAIINKKKKQASQSNQQNSFGNANIFLKWISYCGEFKSNRFEGEGTLYLQGGEKFVGWFKNGASEGQGSLFRKNGQVETGRWKNNVIVERFETQWN